MDLSICTTHADTSISPLTAFLETDHPNYLGTKMREEG
jgi:hypothetical protein